MDTPPTARLLIVDDEAAQVTALCRTLQMEGYSVTGFVLASEALAAVRDGAFDIVITDLMMPEMDGIALLRAARELDADLVGIVMTGHGTIDTAVEALKSGALDYILKPFNLNAILSVLSRALAICRLRHENAALLQRVTRRTAELEAANRELEAANKELESFAYSVSHDLRAPLRAINSFSQQLIDKFGGEMSKDARKLLNRIGAKTRDMAQLIEDLLRFSRLSRQPLVRQSVDVTSLVREVLGELRAEEPDRDVAIVVHDLPDAVADPSLLKQVLVNLEANALKFTRHCARPMIEIDGWRNQDECLYCIRDNGAGFDMRYSDKLFGIFQRLHRADEFEGTGIGLSIAQRVIERHGGRIWADAEMGKGATFTFTLPVLRAAAESAA
jgi:two-component system sensor histidine kinase/response regulator